MNEFKRYLYEFEEDADIIHMGNVLDHLRKAKFKQIRNSREMIKNTRILLKRKKRRRSIIVWQRIDEWGASPDQDGMTLVNFTIYITS